MRDCGHTSTATCNLIITVEATFCHGHCPRRTSHNLSSRLSHVQVHHNIRESVQSGMGVQVGFRTLLLFWINLTPTALVSGSQRSRPGFYPVEPQAAACEW